MDKKKDKNLFLLGIGLAIVLIFFTVFIVHAVSLTTKNMREMKAVSSSGVTNIDQADPSEENNGSGDTGELSDIPPVDEGGSSENNADTENTENGSCSDIPENCQPVVEVTDPERTFVLYVVRPHDNLTKIAREHDTSVRLLAESNSYIKDIDLIYPGNLIFFEKENQ